MHALNILKTYILKVFDLKEEDIDFNSIGENNFLKSGETINKIDILFKKIEKND